MRAAQYVAAFVLREPAAHEDILLNQAHRHIENLQPDRRRLLYQLHQSFELGFQLLLPLLFIFVNYDAIPPSWQGSVSAPQKPLLHLSIHHLHISLPCARVGYPPKLFATVRVYAPRPPGGGALFFVAHADHQR